LRGRTAKGWFLGSGVEYQSGWVPGLTWKTEYRFSEYDGVDRFERFNGGGVLGDVPGTLVGTFSRDKLTGLGSRLRFHPEPRGAYAAADVHSAEISQVLIRFPSSSQIA
jgi:hypothetical protein